MAAGGKPELRLGLVLYGGVSLAVYIYGVVVEVQRLLQASEALPDSSADEGVSAAYLEALREAGLSGAVVDVVAGTSAGGINGILLAKALAAGADVGEVRDLWLEGGDIGILLNPLEGAEAASLLSTEEFERRLREGFERLDRSGSGGDPDAALDLFVSTTHVRGDRRQFMDALGRGIESLVHRFVVHLKQRPYGRNDFYDPAAREAVNRQLVALSRATSAFPVAFQPVLLEGDRLLGPRAERSGWFADGGILNNKPFTEALRTIFTRSSPEGPVRRWLLSVDPDPKALREGAGPGPEPGFDQVLGAAVAGIPRYQSIASDLEDLESHNASVKRVIQALLEMEEGLARQGATGDVGLGAGAGDSYRQLRRRAHSQQLAEQLMQAARPADRAGFDPEAAAAAFAAAALQRIVSGEEERSRSEDGGYSEARALTTDLAFQRRRIYYLIKLLGMASEVSGDGLDADEVRASLWGAFEAISRAWWEAVAAEELPLAGTKVAADGATLDAHAEAFDLASQRIAAAWPGLAGLSADIQGLGGSLAGVTVALPAAGGETFTLSLADVFAGFSARDFFLLSIEAGGGVRFREVVNHAQISPESATATQVKPGMKLAGDTIGHFGGFLDEGWRRNDVLWGRLDAAEILVQVMLAESTPEAREKATEAICREILRAELPAALDAPDWRTYLAERSLGAVGVGDLTRERRVGLLYRSAVVIREMLGRTSAAAESTAPTEFRSRVLRGVDRFQRRAFKLLILPRLLLERRWRRYARETEAGRKG